MQFLNVNQVLQKWGKYVVQQSRSNLTKAKKGYENKLYKSLGYNVLEKKNATEVSFTMLDYGKFVDKGVRGKDPSKVSPNAKITGQQAPNSIYRFGSGSARGTWDSFVEKMSVWAKSKRLRLRDKKGKFAKGNYEAIGYIVAKNIYSRGIKPTMFFTKPYERAFIKYDKDLAIAIGMDMANEIKEQFNGN